MPAACGFCMSAVLGGKHGWEGAANANIYQQSCEEKRIKFVYKTCGSVSEEHESQVWRGLSFHASGLQKKKSQVPGETQNAAPLQHKAP